MPARRSPDQGPDSILAWLLDRVFGVFRLVASDKKLLPFIFVVLLGGSYLLVLGVRKSIYLVNHVGRGPVEDEVAAEREVDANIRMAQVYLGNRDYRGTVRHLFMAQSKLQQVIYETPKADFRRQIVGIDNAIGKALSYDDGLSFLQDGIETARLIPSRYSEAAIELTLSLKLRDYHNLKQAEEEALKGFSLLQKPSPLPAADDASFGEEVDRLKCSFHSSLGNIYSDEGDEIASLAKRKLLYGKAKKEHALAFDESRDDGVRHAIAIQDLASDAYRDKKYSEAWNLANEAAGLNGERSFDSPELGANLSMMALCDQRRHDWSRAEAEYDQALVLNYFTMGPSVQLAKTLHDFAELKIERGNFADAALLLEKARQNSIESFPTDRHDPESVDALEDGLIKRLGKERFLQLQSEARLQRVPDLVRRMARQTHLRPTDKLSRELY